MYQIFFFVCMFWCFRFIFVLIYFFVFKCARLLGHAHVIIVIIIFICRFVIDLLGLIII